MKKRLLLILLILAMTFIFAACGASKGEPLNPQSEEYKTIEIAMGSTGVSISEQLVSEGIIADAKDFKNYLKKNSYDSKLQAGVYTFSPNMDYETIAQILVGGKVATKNFTIPEGLTVKQTVQKLVDQGLGDYDKFMDVIQNGDFNHYPWLGISLESNGYDRLEGFLLPNTYTIPINYEEADIIDFLLKQFEKYIVEDRKEMTLSDFNDLMVKASIIERESKVDEERPLVASVIENRLAKGMMLQMDCTINYLFLQETGAVKENLLYSDLEWDSPYNTYKYTGLPPHPICNPGIKSIEAAENPAQTDYLYYVVSGELDGHHNFSDNYGDFSKFVQEYDKAKTEQNNAQ